MKTIAIAFLAFVLMVFTAPTGAVAEQTRMLTGAEITEAFSDSRVAFMIGQHQGLAMYHPNGTLSGSLGDTTDTGKWSVRGDTLCGQWQRWGQGALNCYGIAIVGDNALWYDEAGALFNRTMAPVR